MEEQVERTVLWKGQGTFKVKASLYSENRKRLLAKLAPAVEGFEGASHGAWVVLQGGESQLRYDTDHEPIFRQESYFSYLFGVVEPDFYGAMDALTGHSLLFMPRLPDSYAVWMGTIHGPQHFKEKYCVDQVFYVDEMPSALRRQVASPQGSASNDRPSSKVSESTSRHHSISSTSNTNDPSPLLLLLEGVNSDSGNKCKPAQFTGIDSFPTNSSLLFPLLSECRVFKSAQELDLLRYANRVSSAGHVHVMRHCRPGMTEYQLESLFTHFVHYYGGCRHCSYTCICASGSNSSVLHYGHAAAPNERTLEDGDIALLDMGAEYACYASDITCSYPVNGKFTDDQRSIYEAVLSAQKAVISLMKPGVSWVDMHKLAERKILDGLVNMGALNGSIDDLMAHNIGAVFMPHGLGHFMGLDTHDVGGYNEGAIRLTAPGVKSLRTTRVLQAGMVITVEPGCYFIPSVLDPAMEGPLTYSYFNRQRIEELRGMGGVRLEDDVVVTDNGVENMTICPREVEDVEAVMKGQIWEGENRLNIGAFKRDLREVSRN